MSKNLVEPTLKVYELNKQFELTSKNLDLGVFYVTYNCIIIKIANKHKVCSWHDLFIETKFLEIKQIYMKSVRFYYKHPKDLKTITHCCETRFKINQNKQTRVGSSKEPSSWLLSAYYT